MPDEGFDASADEQILRNSHKDCTDEEDEHIVSLALDQESKNNNRHVEHSEHIIILHERYEPDHDEDRDDVQDDL